MAEPSTLIPNLSEIIEEYTQTEGEVHLEPTRENRPSEQPEVQPITKQQRRKGKEKQQEEEEEDFVSEEAYSVWKKHYVGKGFVGERGFSQLISPFKELIEHQKSGYAAVVREFYSNLVGRKENSIFVRGVWVPYGAETINEMYGMEGQKHGSKYKKIADSPNHEKIARKLTDGKVKWGQGRGEKKIINRGDMTEEAKVWFYFLASVLVPTKHVCTVREQDAIILYAILKGYKLNAGAIIENSIMKYHEGNKRADPSPSNYHKVMYKGWCEGNLGRRRRVPQGFTINPDWGKQGAKKSKEKGGHSGSRF